MMKLKSVVIIILMLTQIACNKKDNSGPGSNNGENTDSSSNLDPLIIEKALFTEPVLVKARRKSTVIQENLVKYINHTPKGADIYMSIFKFYDPLIVNAVEDAAKRGVNVKILIDSSETKQGGSRDANRLTFAKLQYAFSHSSSNSKVIGINNQITSSAINHEKYVLFSELNLSEGIAKNVVFNASYNFIESAATRANDAVVMTNESLYNIFVEHWNDLAAHADKNMENYEYTVKDVGDSITAFFFPRRSGGSWDGNKTIVEQLDGLTNLSEDTICVLMAGWSGARGLDIAKKLTSLYAQGATVDVIASSITAAATRTELSKLKPPRGHVTIVNFNHSKTMLIKGFWKGEKQTIILTGSKNFYTGGLQYSNNVLLRLKNSALFNDYWRNFEAIKP